jgi:hypothetical protein
MKSDPHALYFQARIEYLKKKVRQPEVAQDVLRRKPYLHELRAIVFHLSTIRLKDRCASSTTLRFQSSCGRSKRSCDRTRGASSAVAR